MSSPNGIISLPKKLVLPFLPLVKEIFQTNISNKYECRNYLNPNYVLQVFSNGGVMAYVDGTLDSTNWMKAINCARYKKEQNLVIIQIEDDVFYESMRDIGPGEELLVWYGNDYERYMDIPFSHKEVVPKKEKSISEDTEGE